MPVPPPRRNFDGYSSPTRTGWPLPSLPDYIHQHWAYVGKGENRTKKLYFYNSRTKETSSSAFAWLGNGVDTGDNDGVTSTAGSNRRMSFVV